MANPIISRDEVHRLAEACSDDPQAFQSVATRLLTEHRRLVRFIDANASTLERKAAETCLYMTSVSIRIFDRIGGRMKRARIEDLDDASARISAVVDSLLPADRSFPERVRQVEWRAQPHLLDEILWALFEKEMDKEEVELDEPTSVLVFLTLWAIVETLDKNWTAPSGYGAE